jgi:hypothetical protein
MTMQRGAAKEERKEEREEKSGAETGDGGDEREAKAA